MRNVYKILLVLVQLSVIVLFVGCAGSRQNDNTFADRSVWGTEQLLNESRSMALSAMKDTNRGRSKDSAERGIEFAERCLMSAPEEVGCYYWRAANTGLYYRIHVIGYQIGIKRMISDCDKVIQIDPKYEHAGAYRMLGQIYTQLPQTVGRPDSVTRDLDKAEEYLRKAVQLAPDYPENHLALSETLFDQDKFDEAFASLANAKNLTPQWRNDVSYNDWRDTTVALERKIMKAKK